MSMRAQTTVQHQKIGRKPSARLAQRGLHAHAVQAVRLRHASARQGAAGIPMASHTAVANAFMRHNGRKQAAHGQSKPPPTASFDRELRRCGSAALDAEEQATAQLGGQLHRVGVARPVAQRSLH